MGYDDGVSMRMGTKTWAPWQHVVSRRAGSVIGAGGAGECGASGVCGGRLLRVEDGRERLPDRARRGGRARRSSSGLRLEGRQPHGDVCGRAGVGGRGGGRLGGAVS